MIIANSLSEIPPLSGEIALTIGFFDGVHSGHRFLFSELKKLGKAAVLTFSNHPAEVLKGKSPALLTTLEERLGLFEKCGIDLAIILPFTAELAAKTYDVFLRELKKQLPFTFLILGSGDAFGRGRQGNEENLKLLEEKLHFKAVFLPKLGKDGSPVSSGRIRRLLASGETELIRSLA